MTVMYKWPRTEKLSLGHIDQNSTAIFHINKKERSLPLWVYRPGNDYEAKYFCKLPKQLRLRNEKYLKFSERSWQLPKENACNIFQ